MNGFIRKLKGTQLLQIKYNAGPVLIAKLLYDLLLPVCQSVRIAYLLMKVVGFFGLKLKIKY